MTNVVELLQTKLVKNFTLIQQKFNSNHHQLTQHKEEISTELSNNQLNMLRLETMIKEQAHRHQQEIEMLKGKIDRVEENQIKNIN